MGDVIDPAIFEPLEGIPAPVVGTPTDCPICGASVIGATSWIPASVFSSQRVPLGFGFTAKPLEGPDLHDKDRSL